MPFIFGAILCVPLIFFMRSCDEKMVAEKKSYFDRCAKVCEPMRPTYQTSATNCACDATKIYK